MLYYEYQAEVLKMTVKRFTEQEKLEENCEPKTMDVEELLPVLAAPGRLLFAEEKVAWLANKNVTICS